MKVSNLIKLPTSDVLKAFEISDTSIQECYNRSLYSLYDIFREYLRSNNDLFGVISNRDDIYTLNLLMYEIKKQCSDIELNIIKFDNLNYRGTTGFANEIPITQLEETTLKSLRSANQISSRAFNVCGRLGLVTVYDMVYYSINGGEFSQHPNAGRKTAEELNAIVRSYSSQLTEQDRIAIRQDQSQFKSGHLNSEGTKRLPQNTELTNEELYEKLLLETSTKTKKILKNISYRVFVQDFLHAKREELKLQPGIGDKTISEIIYIQNILMDNTRNVEDANKDGSICTKSIPNILLLFPEFADNEFVNNYFNQMGHLPMLWILEHFLLLNSDKKTAFHVFKNAFFSNGDILSNAAKSHDISRNDKTIILQPMRFRSNSEPQMVGDPFEQVDIRLSVPSLWRYLIDRVKVKPVLYPETNVVKDACNEEGCTMASSFAFDFVIRFIEPLYENFIYPTDLNHSSKHVYSVKRNLFNFHDFFNTYKSFFLNGALPCNINIRELVHVSNFWPNFCYDNFDDVIKVVETVLYEEYGFETDLEGNIYIPCKNEKDVHGILHEIIKRNREPMHIDDIFKVFKYCFPNHKYTSANQIRSILARDNRITQRNRNSTFMLVEWEGKFKSGTIRDTIIECLQKEDAPQDIKTIAEYVKSHFGTANERSIRNTMLEDSQKRFLLFDGKYFGLSSKTYPDCYVCNGTASFSKKAFEERLQNFVEFVEKYKRLPSAKNKSNGESSLLAWWYRCIKGHIKLTQEQQQQIAELQQKYAQISRNQKWTQALDDTKKFISSNNRLPRLRGNEKRLNKWLNNNLKKYHEGNLVLDEKNAKSFSDLIGLLKEKGLLL